ncbi:uncharacterized protein [Asterias amurensis]|uniref:uncharacterized protein isoform X4 n=1 Tax=Asterias amurensis TaxID=7602 RepID=UPI003AB35850
MECLLKLLLATVFIVGVACLPTPFHKGRNCHIDGFELQEDFSLERFMGTWYAVAHVQRTDYPYQRRSHYAMREDGSISMKTNRVMRPGDCNSWHFEASGQLDEESNHPAKMWLYPPMENYPPENYWVVSTDYTTYALVYSCSQQKRDGSCTKRGEHAWLMGRAPGPLPEQIRLEVSEMMSELCIKPQRLNDVPVECDKELRAQEDTLTSTDCLNDEGVNCTEGPSIPSPCAVSTFEVQQDFIVEKFLGEWYEIAHTRHENSLLKLPDMRSMFFRRGLPDQDAHMALLMKDLKLRGVCAHFDMPGSGWMSSDHPAKITVQFPIPEKYGVSGPVPYWILSTDYTNYAITYSCHVTEEDGTCDKQREVLWVLSRTATLPEEVERKVDEIIRGVCLDPVQVIQNEDVCFTPEMGELQVNETTPIIIGKAAVTTGCDPETAKYGCCLLNNQPATGLNFEGCPRVSPPMAGQEMDSGLLSEGMRRQPIALALSMGPEPLKVKRECDVKIICKMFCIYGFKLDEDNCPVCQCSETPQVPTELATAPKDFGNMAQTAGGDSSAEIQHEAARLTKMTSCLHQATSSPSSKHAAPVLDCEPDGTFTQIQCHVEECWCVDQSTGVEIQSTRVSHDTKPDCSQSQDKLTTPIKGSKMKISDCLTRRSEAEQYLESQDETSKTLISDAPLSVDSLEVPSRIYLPACDKGGQYQQIQCYMGSDICWCVDRLTGEEVGDSMVDGQLPACAP